MLSYNQVIKLNKGFADAHKMLKNFGNGADFNTVLHDKENPYRYPIMWLEDLPSPIEAYRQALTDIILAEWDFLWELINGKKKERGK